MQRALMLAFVAMTACQTYDFQEVAPLTYRQISVTKALRGARPDVMVLLDRSGSMGFPIDRSVAPCTQTCADFTSNPCPAGCATRIKELRAAMPDFFNQARLQARFGLTLFPVGSGVANQCRPASTETTIEPLPAEGPETDANLATWAAQTDRIRDYISNTLVLGGGTPTAPSLEFIGTVPGLAEPSSENRTRVVLLLTDGEPNCKQPDESLIDVTTPSAVAGLRTKGIGTIVIGFGADVNNTASAGPKMLSDMARAGGYGRKCREQADCGGTEVCEPDGLCTQAAYTARNAAELRAVLATLRAQIVGNTDPCAVKLDNLVIENVFVNLDGRELVSSPTTWTREGRTVQFHGQICTLIMESTESNPVNIDIGVW